MIGDFTRGIKPSELRDILQTNAQRITEGEYFKPLTEDEIDERRQKHTENCIQLSDLEAKKALAMEHFKGKIRPLQEVNGILLTEIKSRQIKQDGILYDIANYDDDVMETYNEHGELISYRRLRPAERQGGGNVFALPVAK